MFKMLKGSPTIALDTTHTNILARSIGSTVYNCKQSRPYMCTTKELLGAEGHEVRKQESLRNGDCCVLS